MVDTNDRLHICRILGRANILLEVLRLVPIVGGPVIIVSTLVEGIDEVRVDRVVVMYVHEERGGGNHGQ